MKIYSSLILLGLMAFSFLSAQERKLSNSEIPKPIVMYVSQNFPAEKIFEAETEGEKGDLKYEIKLTNGVEIDFNKDYRVTSIKSDFALPDQVILPEILEYVKRNYPGKTIREWEAERNGQKVELDNDLELYFNKKGEFKRLDR
ncbi:MAG: PepSY-like domain-containing protein [Flavobacteriaceae bacterium]|nr:PepSY-like domain-containing protein [Flavobacteriaceae bacterium]